MSHKDDVFEAYVNFGGRLPDDPRIIARQRDIKPETVKNWLSSWNNGRNTPAKAMADTAILRKYFSILRSRGVSHYQIADRPRAPVPSGRADSSADKTANSVGSREQSSPSDRQACDVVGPPKRKEITATRVVRDTSMTRELKKRHQYRCQLCGNRLKLGDGQFYAEAHHLQPLGGHHRGPDVTDNIIIVCPNCHVLLDFGAIRLNAGQLKKQQYGPSQHYMRYHNRHVFRQG